MARESRKQFFTSIPFYNFKNKIICDMSNPNNQAVLVPLKIGWCFTESSGIDCCDNIDNLTYEQARQICDFCSKETKLAIPPTETEFRNKYYTTITIKQL